ncbi:DoxX family protein [Deinococcus sp. KNUC1210]|uniref:DoxX family protein n=1 Tax=Deinococcus sp. KNUC1210 TaxID=2917691 RepID=UPI001EF01FA3|nr:DoxX family protein [Deinococcus sp. KNUC1210]ULH14529.1 DoxX family protein [Deinococcus sp. KNUC1210]
MFPTNGVVGLTVLRVIVAIIFLVHGYQKFFLLGLGNTGTFFGSVGIPLPQEAALLVAALEILGGLLILLGVLTRLMAFLLIFDPLVAMFTVHLPKGFFASDGGYEFVLLLVMCCVVLVISGPGRYALLDRPALAQS